MLASQTDGLATHQHDLKTKNIVGRETILQAMHPAGVFRDIAADGASDLRRWVGRVIKSPRLDGPGNGKILHAGLNARATVFVIDLQNAIKLRHAKQQTVFKRHRAARQRCARTARNDLDVHFRSEAQDRLNLLDRFRQDDNHRQGAIHGEGVTLVSAARGFINDQALRRQQGSKPPDDLVPPREDSGLRRRHDQGQGICPLRVCGATNSVDPRIAHARMA